LCPLVEQEWVKMAGGQFHPLLRLERVWRGSRSNKAFGARVVSVLVVLA
jgi:hypothetical protein